MSEAKIVGKVVLKSLDAVGANPWNPNRMTTFERDALKNGLQSDGWLSSQALLIWGTDASGEKKNLIIDGEHRWTMARELGFDKGPMVFLENLTEAQAKALTVKMNSKRGKFQDDLLGALIRDIQLELEAPDLGLELGIAQDDLMRYMAVEAQELDEYVADARPPLEAAPSGAPTLSTPHIRMVQLFFDKEQHEEFVQMVDEFGASVSARSVSEIVLEVLRRVRSGRAATLARQ
jgi:hypothetical protein